MINDFLDILFFVKNKNDLRIYAKKTKRKLTKLTKHFGEKRRFLHHWYSEKHKRCTQGVPL